MKRWVAMVSIGGVALCSMACKSSAKVRPRELVPEGATVMASIDAKAVVASKTYQANRAMIEQGEGRARLEALRACSLGPETWRRVVVGMDALAPQDKLVLVLSADGLGKKATLECLAEQYGKLEQAPSWTMEEQAGRITLSMSSGAYKAFVVDDNTLAVAASGWIEALEGLLAGEKERAAAVNGSLKPLLARVDESDDIWLVGSLPPAYVPPPVSGAKDASLTVNLDDGLSMTAAVGFPSPQDAKSKSDALRAQFQASKTLLQGAGIPHGIIDGVVIEPVGDNVSLSVKISGADIERLAQEAARHVDGLQ